MLTALLLLLSAQAAPMAGVTITVTVVDPSGDPIPSAQIRHPEESEKHRVDTESASWSADAVYLASGEELLFEKKMVLPLEISAPGFETQTIELVVEKKAKKNVHQIHLTKLDLSVDTDATGGGPSIGFKHDQPRD